LIFSACIDRLIANRCRTIHLLRCTATLGPPSVRRLASRRCGGIHALLAALHPTDRPPTPLLTTTAQHHAGPLFPHVIRCASMVSLSKRSSTTHIPCLLMP